MYFVSRDGGYIAEFDPNTRYVREFRIAGGNVQLEDLCFDHNGVIWFTTTKAQPPRFPQGGKVGRLNLFTSEVRLTGSIGRTADPHELAVNSKGTIFLTELGAAKVGSVEPDSMRVTEHPLPNAKIGASGIAITPDDAVWITDAARGMLVRFDVASGKYQEWPSPNGALSKPGVMATANGVIWYVEAGATPNVLVRFDPETNGFSSWPVEVGGVIGRISAQPDGTLWFTLPSLNKIGELSPEGK
jgi:virginiamycin B lyase